VNTNDLSPRLWVNVIIETSNGVVLGDYEGKWYIPGGAVLHGEILAEAAKRVAREETGTEVVIEKVLGYIEYPEKVNIRGNGWSVGIVFQAKINGGELINARTFKNLPEEMIWEHKNFLKKK
jgi:8-oxo-dGTP diphosphatase